MSFAEILRTLLIGYPLPPEMVDARFPVFFQQLGGLCLALVVTGLSFLFGGPLGLVLALWGGGNRPVPSLGRKLLASVATIIVEGIQSIPVMILVLLAFYLPYRLWGLRVPPAILAVAAFSLYNAVYISGIIRSGLSAVEPGWLEAAKTLGLSRGQVLWRIQLPIAARTMLPALLGQAITVFKDTSVLAMVAVGELTYSARMLQISEPVNYGQVLLLVLLLYWSVAAAGSVLAARLDAAWQRRLLG